MADPLKTTVAIVATPAALEDVRHRLRRSGIRTAEMEVAEMQLERKLLLEGELVSDGSARTIVLATVAGAAIGVLLVVGWMQVLAFWPACFGAVGGAALGAVGFLVVSTVGGGASERTAAQKRSLWKIRVGGDSTLVAKARGLASSTGQTILRLSTGAFEVPAKRPSKS